MNDNSYRSASEPPRDPQNQPASEEQAVHVSVPESFPYVTYAIIGITVLFYLLQVVSVWAFGHPPTFTNMDWLEYYGARINRDILEGELWRLITPALLHGPPTHILFNMYALISFGTSLERYFGHGRFLMLYILGAFAGNVLSFLMMDDRSYSVGASTAVFGLIGAEGVFLFQNRKLFAGQFRSAIGNVIFVAAVNLFIIGALPGIDNWGHIGGLLGGLIFTSFAGPVWAIEGIRPMYRFVDRREAGGVLIGLVIVLFIFGGLAFWKLVS